jgi:cellobiose phosphorylase
MASRNAIYMNINYQKIPALFLALLVNCLAQTKASSDWFEFAANGRECIVKKSDLPTPWLNRLGNDVFFTWVTHNGYIESFLLDPTWNGLTNPQATSGRFYIRDKKTGTSFQINRPLGKSDWQCRVGLGYNRISNHVGDLRGEATYFVPRGGDDVLLMLVEIANMAEEAKDVDVFSQVEWNLGDATKSIIYRGDGRGGSQFNLYKRVVMEKNILLAQQTNWKVTGACKPWPYTGFFTVSEPVTSYDAIKNNFIGPGRDVDNPEAVEKGACTNTEFWSQAEYPWGVLHNTITLQPGERKSLVYVLGMSRNRDSIPAIAARYGNVDAAQAALATVNGYYARLTRSAVEIETPDKENDRIINIWSKYQWRQHLKKSLNDGSYGLGMWSYGIEGDSTGMRSELMLLPLDMEILKNSVLAALRSQLRDTTQTQIAIGIRTTPYADSGLSGPDLTVRRVFAVPHHSAIMVLLPSLYYYLRETGDLSFLNEKLPYVDGTEATVWEHIRTALTIAVKGIDERGLPRIPTGVGDWNDEFTRISTHDQAESVMLAGELAFLLKSYADVAGRYKDETSRAKWMELYGRLEKGVNEVAWDGKWYIRAFSDRGDPPLPVGSASNAEGKIHLNAQSWAILSGIAPPARAATALASVQEHLMSEFGPLLFYPSYSQYVPYIGTQSIYAPGFRNGCIYMRPAGWAIMAACLGGQDALANQMYDGAALTTRARHIEQFECEPYVYPENYNGPDHRLKGRGEFQWNFGEGAAWMWFSYVGYILGVRPEMDGLVVDPHIPANWSGYKIRREFRGKTYEIEVQNPDHRSSGVRSILIDGKRIEGHLLQGREPGGHFKVLVTL